MKGSFNCWKIKSKIVRADKNSIGKRLEEKINLLNSSTQKNQEEWKQQPKLMKNPKINKKEIS